MRFSTLMFLLLPPLFWAGNIVLGRAMVGHIPPLALSFWRWTIAFAVIAPFTLGTLWAQRQELKVRWRDLLMLGIVGIGIYNSFQYLALQTSPALNVTLIVASGPVFTLLSGALFFHSPVSRGQVIGAALSLLGVLWVVAHGDVEKILALRLTPGDGYILFAIATWSIYTWWLRTRRPNLAAAPLLTAQMFIGALAILPFYLAEQHWNPVPLQIDPRTLWTLAYVGLFPSLAAYFCWDRAVARTGANLPAYFVNLTPVFAAGLAGIFLGESIALFHLVGALLIFLGIVVAMRAPRRKAA